MKCLSKIELLAKTKELVAQERKITNELIAHLEEIQNRRTYAELGYSSMWEFATQYLGLSEGAAQRRISAMRLASAVPEAKAALESGKLSLSNAAKIQSFRQAEKKAGRATDGADLVSKIESKSQQECETILHSISPTSLLMEKQCVVSANGDREIRVVLTQEVYEKLSRLKGLLDHTLPNATLAELIEYMVNQTTDGVEKKRGIVAKNPAAAAAVENGPPKTSSPKSPDRPDGQRVYLPIKLKQAVWKRSGGKCEYQSPDGRRCQSWHRLEIDHRVPLALNGSNELSNLRILCRTHNVQQAGEKIGRGKI